MDRRLQSPPGRCLVSRGVISMRPARFGFIGRIIRRSAFGFRRSERNGGRVLPCIFTALLFLARIGFAADLKPPGESSWPSFRKTPNLTGVAHTQLPEKLELLWQGELGDQILASAAIVGDHVYVPCLSGEI